MLVNEKDGEGKEQVLIQSNHIMCQTWWRQCEQQPYCVAFGKPTPLAQQRLHFLRVLKNNTIAKELLVS